MKKEEIIDEIISLKAKLHKLVPENNSYKSTLTSKETKKLALQHKKDMLKKNLQDLQKQYTELKDNELNVIKARLRLEG